MALDKHIIGSPSTPEVDNSEDISAIVQRALRQSAPEISEEFFAAYRADQALVTSILDDVQNQVSAERENEYDGAISIDLRDLPAYRMQQILRRVVEQYKGLIDRARSNAATAVIDRDSSNRISTDLAEIPFSRRTRAQDDQLQQEKSKAAKAEGKIKRATEREYLAIESLQQFLVLFEELTKTNDVEEAKALASQVLVELRKLDSVVSTTLKIGSSVIEIPAVKKPEALTTNPEQLEADTAEIVANEHPVFRQSLAIQMAIGVIIGTVISVAADFLSKPNDPEATAVAATVDQHTAFDRPSLPDFVDMYGRLIHSVIVPEADRLLDAHADECDAGVGTIESTFVLPEDVVCADSAMTDGTLLEAAVSGATYQYTIDCARDVVRFRLSDDIREEEDSIFDFTLRRDVNGEFLVAGDEATSALFHKFTAETGMTFPEYVQNLLDNDDLENILFIHDGKMVITADSVMEKAGITDRLSDSANLLLTFVLDPSENVFRNNLGETVALPLVRAGN